MATLEQNMVNAVRAGSNWAEGNTSVIFSDAQTLGTGAVYLHGNLIAIIMEDGSIRPNREVIRKYPTKTTFSRLVALGVDAKKKNNVHSINGEPI